MSQKLGKYFTIQNRKNKLLLGIKNGADAPGAFIVTTEPSASSSHTDSQLWFFDPITSTVRSKLNRFCLEVNPDDKIIVSPYQSGNGNQKWVVTDSELQMMDDFEMLIGISAGSRVAGAVACCVQNDGSEWFQWNFEHTPAQFFKLRSRLVTHKILDVEKASKKSGAKVIIWVDKGNLADNQLWYEDKNGILRSRLSDFALDSSDKKEIVLKSYDHSKESQQWYSWGGTIRNRFDKSKVLAVKKGAMPVLFYDGVQAEAYDGDMNQLWTVEYLPDDSSTWNHGGFGKHFYIRNVQTGLVFALKNKQLSPKTEVVTCPREAEYHDYDAQLFYVDELTCTIRATANNYCLDIKGDKLVINPYDPFVKKQHWKIFGRKIKFKDDPEKVLTAEDSGYDVYKNEDDSEEEQVRLVRRTGGNVTLKHYHGGDLQHFEITHVKARCFYMRSLYNNKVLDVKQNNQSVGADICLWEPKPKVNFNQLFYEDERGILRSRLNGYVLQLTSRGGKTAAFDPGAKDQHYVIVGDRVQNMHNAELVLEANTKKALGAIGLKGEVVAGKYDGDTNQKWAFDFV